MYMIFKQNKLLLWFISPPQKTKKQSVLFHKVVTQSYFTLIYVSQKGGKDIHNFFRFLLNLTSALKTMKL